MNDGLELEGITRVFGTLVALEDVSLRVPAGERRVILGANGAGKTTLFNVISGDFRPTRGRIRFFGQEISTEPPFARTRLGLRRTYQKSLLFASLSVFENVFLALRGVARGRMSLRRPQAGQPAMEAAAALVERIGLAALADTPVAELAHGQQRQLEIGMALAGAPRLILLDEPAAGLSAGERGELLALLENLPRGLGFVLIEHDLDLALALAERVTIMHQGRILVEGSPAEIQRDARVQEIYLGGGQA